jgi:adenine-specific DNA-methyltransferase
MARLRNTTPTATKSAKRKLEQYRHQDKQRANNPPVGLVTQDTDRDMGTKKTYSYDPHLDPVLTWAGKAEHTSFDVPTVSLHVHERIDPRTILEAVHASNGSRTPTQGSLFEQPTETLPLRQAVNFYKHAHGWSNRLIAGDSLLVMNSLLEKEGLGGQVQMLYIDPPYGIRYGSNFQPFVNKRDVKDGSDEDLTAEPEMLKAFRDTWELGIHSYLTYLRDRLLLAREMLHESGSCFVQISDENLHLVRQIMDEVFGIGNFASLIVFTKAAGGLQAANRVGVMTDYLVWYFKNVRDAKYRPIFEKKSNAIDAGYTQLELKDGTRRGMTKAEKARLEEVPEGSRPFMTVLMTKPGPGSKFTVEYQGRTYDSGKRWWGITPPGIENVIRARRIAATENAIRFVTYFDDFPYRALTNLWDGLGGAADPVYVVQTSPEVIRRCMLMTTDPGDLVLDPTCGSGTTAYVAEQWGRRWVTTDTSRVALTLAKQRLMTATFDYYKLAHPEQGVGSGFNYKTVPHVTLKSIANNPEIKEGLKREEIDRAIAKYAETETLYDQPEIDRSKARVTGPFTVEAVPAAVFGRPEVRPIGGEEPSPRPSSGVPGEGERGVAGEGERGVAGEGVAPDASIAREGQTLRQSEWRAELLKTGIRAKGGAKIEFVRVDPLPGTRWLSADAETKEERPRRAVISFGPEHAPLEQRQVASALEEAQTLVPRPALVIFASLQFDPEAAKDIDETRWPGVTMLKAQMNGDLVTEDLKKNRSSNESFWLIGQPDIELRKVEKKSEDRRQKTPPHPALSPEYGGEGKAGGAEKFVVEIHGFDYYNPKSGNVESGGKANIAMWMLDTDYDGRSVYPRQVFFPMAGPKDGWARLAKNLKAEIDQELIEQYRGTVSLPFEKGKYGRAAVKIVDDRGIESLRIVEVPRG